MHVLSHVVHMCKRACVFSQSTRKQNERARKHNKLCGVLRHWRSVYGMNAEDNLCSQPGKIAQIEPQRTIY